MVRRWRLIGYFPILYNPPSPDSPTGWSMQASVGASSVVLYLMAHVDRLGADGLHAHPQPPPPRARRARTGETLPPPVVPAGDLGYRGGVRGAVGLGYRVYCISGPCDPPQGGSGFRFYRCSKGKLKFKARVTGFTNSQTKLLWN
jgi:hypothetical protein